MIDFIKPATEQQLIDAMRLADKLTIQQAASLLGRTDVEVMDMVANGELMAWTHSAAHGELLTHTNHKTGMVQQLPRIAPDTDPTSVRVTLDDVVWMWCVQEERPRYYPNLPPKEVVERRMQALNEQARCAIAPLAQPPAPAQTAAPAEDAAPAGAVGASGGEFTKQRQARRYQACIDAGLTMPSDDYSHLPRGIGALAKAEGIKRQSFAEDVKAHINRTNSR